MFSEKDMEDAIAINPARFLKKEGLKLLSQQHSIGNFRFDLLFGDRFGRKFIAEIQKGALDRNHSFKIVEYYNKYQNEHPGEKVEVIFVANTISSERMQFFDKFGISYIEIPDEDIIRWKSENPSIERIIGDPKTALVKSPGREHSISGPTLCGNNFWMKHQSEFLLSVGERLISQRTTSAHLLEKMAVNGSSLHETMTVVSNLRFGMKIQPRYISRRWKGIKQILKMNLARNFIGISSKTERTST